MARSGGQIIFSKNPVLSLASNLLFIPIRRRPSRKNNGEGYICIIIVLHIYINATSGALVSSYSDYSLKN